MPARDIYHEVVKNALNKDGWAITHDPLRLQWGPKDVYVDLGAERLLAAEKSGQKIAIEIKSFVGSSVLSDLENAVGQYILYRDILAQTEPEREVYLAIHEAVYIDVFLEPIGQLLRTNNRIKLLVFEPKNEVILQWIP